MICRQQQYAALSGVALQRPDNAAHGRDFFSRDPQRNQNRIIYYTWVGKAKRNQKLRPIVNLTSLRGSLAVIDVVPTVTVPLKICGL